MAVNWNEISNKIVIEGEAEYKKSMADINRALREAKSEMKAAAAEYDANSDSIDALKASMDALHNVEQGQSLALATMEKHLKRVEETTGESSKEAVELRTKINNLRAEITRTNSDLNRFETMLQDARGEMADVKDDAEKAGDAIAGVGKDAEKAEDGVGGLVGELSKAAGLDLESLTGVAALAAAGKFTLEIVQGSVNAGVEQTQARGQLAAYTGASGAELDALEEVSQTVYREGFGESLKDAAQGVATLHSYTGLVGPELETAVQMAFRLSDVFGMDINESARTAQQMASVFGTTIEEAYGLVVAGAQEGADKNGNLLDTINEYAKYYEMAGKSAQEMVGSLIAGSQAGVYDVDKIGDAMKEFTIRLTDGSEATAEALKGLGLEAVDVPAKFGEGGATASAAFDLIIDRLLAIEDPLQRSQLGIALFGTQWEDTAGAVLGIFDQIAGATPDVANAMETLYGTMNKDLELQAERVGRQIEASAGEMARPIAEAGAEALKALADNIESNRSDAPPGIDILAGIGETYKQSNEQLAQTVSESFDATFGKEGTIARELAEAAPMPWDSNPGADWFKAEELAAGMTQAGEAGAQAFEDTRQDAQDAGKEYGEAAVLGAEDGLEGMEQAGEDAADGAVAGALSRESAMYAAGARLGGAFVRGYRYTMEQRSPSRLMMRTAHDTVDGALEGFKEDEMRMQEAGAALAAAVSGGYGDSPIGGAGASYGTNSGSGGDTVAALREALSGMGIYMKGEKVGELCEMGVSRAQTRRAMNTVSGLSTARKAW